MKKLLLILFLCSVVNGQSEKFTIIGDSKAFSSIIWDTAISKMADGSRYANKSIPGYGWEDFEAESFDYYHTLEGYIITDTSTYIIIEVGVNNMWGTWNITGSTYMNQIDDMRYIDRWYRVAQARGVKMGIVEMGPSWFSSLTDTANTRILAEIKQRNTKRKEWCAYNGVYWIPTFDSLKLSNDHPNPAFHNADMLHYNDAGSALVGRQVAAFINTVPAKSLTYSIKKTAKISVPTYTSSTTLHHVLNVGKIKDTTFWNSAKPDGSNIALFVNGVKTNRILRDLVTCGNRGVLEFVYSGAINTIELKTGDYNERDTIIYTGSNLNRYYRMNEKKSYNTPIIDAVNGYNVTSTAENWRTYYNPTSWGIYDDSTYKKSLTGNTSAQAAPNTGIGGNNKFTFETQMQISSNFWTVASNYIYSMQSTVAMALVLSQSGGIRVYVGSPSQLSYVPYDTASKYLDTTKWHKLTVSMDLSQSVQANKIKVFIDTVDVSGSMIVSGTLGTSIPSLTQDINIFCWYTPGSYWPIGSTFKDYKFYTGTAITPAEAIAEYKLQNSQFTISDIQSTSTGSRRSGYRQINMGQGMH